MEASATRTIGRYRLFHPLATGGTATVYLGCFRADGGFSRAVGIKKLHEHLARNDRLVKALFAEARIVSRIRHPNVVAVLDVVEEEGEKLLVLEYVHGESVSQLIIDARDTSRPMPLDIALRIGVDALEGLHAAHEATGDAGVPLLVVHRDVSPQNIMVDVDGHARIVDFGIAKALERPFTTTNNGEFRGKLTYAAPEQLDGTAVDRRTDIWAMGMMLWELAAGRRFFVDMDLGDIVRRITTEVIPPPSSVNPACPAAIDAILLRALERDPDARFASAREMALALEKAGPVASHREVGRCVRTLARARLDERSRLIREMEDELRRASHTSPVVTTSTAAVAAERAVLSTPPRRRSTRRWYAAVIAALAAAAALVVLARSSARDSAPASALARGSVDPLGRSASVVPAPSSPLPSPLVSTELEPVPSSATDQAARPPKSGTQARPRVLATARAPEPTSSVARPPSQTVVGTPRSADPLQMDDRK